MAQANPGRQQNGLRAVMIVLVGQVGCVTLLVIGLSGAIGLWLDATLHTKPIFTLVLLLAGVPLSVVLMLQVARKAMAKIVRDQESKVSSTP